VKEPGLSEKSFSTEGRKTGPKGQAGNRSSGFYVVVRTGSIGWMCLESGMGNECEPTKGAPGVDGIAIEQIVMSDQGVAGFLEGIQESLRTEKPYRPQGGATASTFRKPMES